MSTVQCFKMALALGVLLLGYSITRQKTVMLQHVAGLFIDEREIAHEESRLGTLIDDQMYEE